MTFSLYFQGIGLNGTDAEGTIGFDRAPFLDSYFKYSTQVSKCFIIMSFGSCSSKVMK